MAHPDGLLGGEVAEEARLLRLEPGLAVLRDVVRLDLAAKVIREGVAYARRFGLKPDRDYYEAASLLEGADPDACDVHVPLGRDGKPFFVAGPYDNAQRIVAQLTRTAGAGNFDFVVPVGMPDDFLLEEG